MYFFLNWACFDAVNDRYLYTDNQTILHLLAETKKIYPVKTQPTSHTCFEYERRRYVKPNGAIV